MKQQSDRAIDPMAVIKALLKGLFISIIFIGLALCLGAFILSSTDFGLSSVNTISIIIASAGAFLTALISSKSLSRAGVIIGIVSAGLMFALLVLIGFLVYNSIPSDCFVKLIFMLVFGIIGGILGVRRVAKRKF